MKKASILLAGLLLVSGTTFAASELDFSGTQVKFKSVLVNSQGKGVNDDSNGDTDAVIQVKYKINDKTSASIKFNTDDDKVDASKPSTMDTTAELLVKRVDGPLEAQFDIDMRFGTGLEIREDYDSSKTYIKWKQSDALTLGFYPFNMGLGNGIIFDKTDAISEFPGVTANFGNTYVGLGYDILSNSDFVQALALKAGNKMTIGGITLNTKYSGVFYDEDKVNLFDLTNGIVKSSLGTVKAGLDGTIGIVSQDISLNANYKLTDKITLDAEGGINTLNKNFKVNNEAEKSGIGFSAKATLKATESLSPYAQVKYGTDGYLVWGEIFDNNMANKKTGGVTELIAGANYTLVKGLNLNAEGSLRTAGEKVYADTKGTANQEKSALQISTAVSYKF